LRVGRYIKKNWNYLRIHNDTAIFLNIAWYVVILDILLVNICTFYFCFKSTIFPAHTSANVCACILYTVVGYGQFVMILNDVSDAFVVHVAAIVL